MLLSSMMALFTSFIPGQRLIDGGEASELASALLSSASGVTASATTGQATATQLTGYINEVSTVGGAAASVMLPVAIPGKSVWVINDQGTNSMQVFGQVYNPNTGVGDTIAAHNSASQTATGTGVALAANGIACYVCFSAGKWKQFLTA
jgi:hypothetical protein